MAKQENLIKKIKSNLCGVFQCITENYEYISYDNKEEKEEPRCDNFDKILPLNLQTKGRSRLPIYHNTPFVTIRRGKGETKVEEDFEFQQQITINNLHSTKLNENIATPNLPLIPVTPPQSNNKASSTMIYEIPKSQKNESVSTPNSISNIRKHPDYDQSLLTTSSDDCESSTFSSASSESLFCYESFEVGSIYACRHAYEIQQNGYLTIKFAERIQIIQDNGDDEFVLVKRLTSHQRGLVPRFNILPVNKFLAYLL